MSLWNSLITATVWEWNQFEHPLMAARRDCVCVCVLALCRIHCKICTPFFSPQFVLSLLNNWTVNAGLYLSSVSVTGLHTHKHTHTHARACAHTVIPEIGNHHNSAAGQESEAESHRACFRFSSPWLTANSVTPSNTLHSCDFTLSALCICMTLIPQNRWNTTVLL